MEYIRAKKSLGQNFLIDHEALFDIASSIEVTGKHIIEVGPGYGALTDYLIEENPATLDLVELDKDMIKILEEKYRLVSDTSILFDEVWDSLDEVFEEIQDVSDVSWISENKSWRESKVNQREEEVSETSINHIQRWEMELHHQDVLKFTPAYEAYSVIANIPYYITSPILFHFLYDLPRAPDSMVIMMQKEVGEKILEWRARKPHHSLLSLAMESACEDISIVRYVWKNSFDPPPKVDSIVLKFEWKKVRDRKQELELIKIWKIAFTHPRKTLLSNFKWTHHDINSIKKWLTTNNYDERVRAEAIKREDWNNFLFSTAEH